MAQIIALISLVWREAGPQIIKPTLKEKKEKSLCFDGFDIWIPDVMEEILLFRGLGYFL